MSTSTGEEIAGDIHRALLLREQTVATAESLTGGLVAAALTTTPGASRSFRGGLVVYATDLKHRLAGVSAGLLAERGAVVAEVAAELATGARLRLGADWGLGLTGVAGPDPQDDQPVGTLHVGVAGPGAAVTVRSFQLTGDRSQIRAAAVRAALTVLHDSVQARE